MLASALLLVKSNLDTHGVFNATHQARYEAQPWPLGNQSKEGSAIPARPPSRRDPAGYLRLARCTHRPAQGCGEVYRNTKGTSKTGHLPVNNPDHFKRGTIVGGNSKAERQDLVRNRDWGTVTSYYPREQIVSVKWNGTKKTERWHVDLLEVIEWA